MLVTLRKLLCPETEETKARIAEVDAALADFRQSVRNNGEKIKILLDHDRFGTVASKE